MTRLSNDDINQLKSYTEVATTGDTALVAVSFDYVYGKDGIVVTIDAKDPTTMGYSVTMPNANTVAFNPSVPTGHTIRLQRETDIDKMGYVFTSGALFIASNMDANFEQIRHAQQDVRDAFNVLRSDFSSVNAASNTAVNAANTALTAANLSYSLLSPFIVGGALSVYTKAQIDALIATGGKSTVLSIESGGTGATTAILARANLGVPSTSDMNATISANTTGKMDKAANLNDVQDKVKARTNLGVYSTSDVDAKFNYPFAAGGTFSGLNISTLGINNYISVVTANSVVVADSNGLSRVCRNINISLDLRLSNQLNGTDIAGEPLASTWYYVYIIYNPSTNTTKGVFSTSVNAPNLGAAFTGYTYYTRVGAVRTDTSAALLQTLQCGRHAQYVVTTASNVPSLPILASGVAGNVNTAVWVAIGLSAFAPQTTVSILLTVTWGALQGAITVAPNNKYGSIASAVNPPPCMWACTAAIGSFSPARLFVESSNIYWSCNTAGSSIRIYGWEDNL